MCPAKNRVSILEQLKQLNQNQSPVTSKDSLLQRDHCRLNQVPCSRCRGHGIAFSPQGFFAHAEVCSCVLECRLCRGKSLDVSSGSAKPCQVPSPVTKANLFNQAHIPVRYAFARLDSFQNQSGNCSDILGQVRSWLERVKTQPSPNQAKGFVLHGGVGVGKTYLLTAVVKELAFLGLSVRFIDFFQLITEIKSRYALKQEIDESLLNPLLNVDVLAIDEMGKGRRTEFEETVIDQLVMGRYNQQKMILATTNHSLDNRVARQGDNTNSFNTFTTLKTAVGERIYSRLIETCEFWKFDGADDFRMTQSKATTTHAQHGK